MAQTSSSGYLAIAAKAQQAVLASIPPQWRLTPESSAQLALSPLASMETSGILTPEQIKITAFTLTELQNRLSSRALAAVEVTEAFCARAALAHQLTNCLTDFFPEEALAEAKACDEHLAQTGKVRGPLHGIPIAIKDIMHVKGKVTTMGFVAWSSAMGNKPADADAANVKTVRDAGAIIFGRTTCPQSGMALETVSNLWGRTLNAINPKFGAGGSSGGEAVLVALRGAPVSALSTDIGGSIRGPAAFNGLYGMRPTYERTPRTGLVHPALGNLSIKSASGPVAHSLEDVSSILQLVLTHPTIPYEPTCSLPFWHPVALPPTKLRVGLMHTDGVVRPHPPVRNALDVTARKLIAAGHEIVDFEPPFDCWEAMLTTFALFFQTGAAEAKALLEQAGEPPIPQFDYNLKVFGVKPLTAAEAFEHNRRQAGYRSLFQQAFDAAGIDCLLCPVAPMAAVPHDFPIWWGYTSLFNLLDHPGVVVPVKEARVDPARDVKDTTYIPSEKNPFDKPNWERYDPALWANQPVCIQIVGRPWRDEVLLSIAGEIDRIVNHARV